MQFISASRLCLKNLHGFIALTWSFNGVTKFSNFLCCFATASSDTASQLLSSSHLLPSAAPFIPHSFNCCKYIYILFFFSTQVGSAHRNPPYDCLNSFR